MDYIKQFTVVSDASKSVCLLVTNGMSQAPITSNADLHFTLEVCMGVGIPMEIGFPWEWEMSWIERGNGNGNQARWEWE